jgi:hypothetical protein
MLTYTGPQLITTLLLCIITLQLWLRITVSMV